MLRSLVLASALTFGLALSASAQVVVNGGTATTYPTSVPAPIANTVTQNGIPSVPAINTPTAHVGPTAEQAPAEGQANAGSPGVPMVSAGQIEAQPPAAVATALPPTNAVSLGVATYSVNPFVAGSAQNNVPLGTIAREYKQKDQNVNAKVYTNADIDKIQGNTYGGAAANANARNDNWPANNGVITQPAIAAPAQDQSTTGTAPVTAPYAPQPQNDGTPTPQPQSLNQKPSADRPVEMAQNNPANAGIPQNADANSQPAPAANSQNTLPKTASRLPLLAVLGFFSVTVGMFVRYQRSKTAR